MGLQQEQGALAVAFEQLTKSNLQALRLLNAAIFPLRYPDQVYSTCMQFPHLTCLAYHGEVLVGGIMARLEMQASGRARLYIASLGVLAPYRGYRIGSRLLARCLAGAAGDPVVAEAVVHMQEDNEEGQRFYERCGFKVVERRPGYYRSLDPSGAVLLARKFCGEKQQIECPDTSQQ